MIDRRRQQFPIIYIHISLSDIMDPTVNTRTRASSCLTILCDIRIYIYFIGRRRLMLTEEFRGSTRAHNIRRNDYFRISVKRNDWPWDRTRKSTFQ